MDQADHLGLLLLRRGLRPAGQHQRRRPSRWAGQGHQRGRHPDHPINEGSLCAKGASTFQLASNKDRPKKPLYRAPGATEWKEVEWSWALPEIAKRVKATRDATFTRKNAAGQAVNRTEAIVSLGSAALDNEECWALQAMQRALGLVHIEHQARL